MASHDQKLRTGQPCGSTQTAQLRVWEIHLTMLDVPGLYTNYYKGDELEIETNIRSNYKAIKYQTKNPKVFTAGDMRRGQSLIVWAISEGRQAAHYVDVFFTGSSNLPLKDDNDLPSA